MFLHLTVAKDCENGGPDTSKGILVAVKDIQTIQEQPAGTALVETKDSFIDSEQTFEWVAKYLRAKELVIG